MIMSSAPNIIYLARPNQDYPNLLMGIPQGYPCYSLVAVVVCGGEVELDVFGDMSSGAGWLWLWLLWLFVFVVPIYIV
jgi:hypothetical protein